MTESRLRWRRGDSPRSFVADIPGGGTAHIQHHDGATRGLRHYWAWRIEIGIVSQRGQVDDSQHSAADAVHQHLPAALAAAADVAVLDAAEAHFNALLEAYIYDQDARLDVAAFGIDVASYDLLLRMWRRLEYWRLAGFAYLGELEVAVRAAMARRPH